MEEMLQRWWGVLLGSIRTLGVSCAWENNFGANVDTKADLQDSCFVDFQDGIWPGPVKLAHNWIILCFCKRFISNLTTFCSNANFVMQFVKLVESA